MRVILACLLTFVLQVPLLADIYERDLISPSDGLLTYDDVNDREWLDLMETAAVDLSVVRASCEPGGSLEGFKFATAQDVQALAISAGVQASPQSSLLSVVTGTQAHKLIRLLGKVVHAEGGVLGELNVALGQVVQAFESEVPIFDETNFFVVSIGRGPPPGTISSPAQAQPGGAYYFSTPLLFPNFPPLGRGSSGPFWLYRKAVPEPRSIYLWLVLFGLPRGVRRVSLRRDLAK